MPQRGADGLGDGGAAGEGNAGELDAAALKRQEHQVMVSCLCNKVIMLHSNPFLGRIFVYELDPSLIYRFQGQVTFTP